MKKGILSTLFNKTTILVFITSCVVWVYYANYDKAEPSSGGIVHTYKPYPLNTGLIHHIVYLDSPILDKPLDLNFWVWATIVVTLVIIVTVMSIVVNSVSLNEEVAN